MQEHTVIVLCHNCKAEMVGWQDEQGRTKVQCRQCGTVTVSIIKSRRHVQLDIYAPKGQVVNNEI